MWSVLKDKKDHRTFHSHTISVRPQRKNKFNQFEHFFRPTEISFSTQPPKKPSNSSFLMYDNGSPFLQNQFQTQHTMHYSIENTTFANLTQTVEVRKTSYEPTPKNTRKKHLRNGKLSKLSQSRVEYNETQMALLRKLLINISGLNFNGYFFVTIEQFRSYLTKRFPQRLVHKLLEFLEFPPKLDYQQYINIVSQINVWKHEDICFLAFYLIDANTDGVICPSDIFQLFRQTLSAQRDFMKLSKVMTERVKLQQEKPFLESPVYPELYHASQITATIYFRISQRQRVQYVNSAVKKDTLYHMGFYGLTHSPEQRQKQLDLSLKEQNSPKKFNHKGQFRPSPFGHVFDNIEQCGINFNSFLQIYETKLPDYFNEIFQFLTLFKFPNTHYDLTTEQILDISLK